jgi:hypothetical protein
MQTRLGALVRDARVRRGLTLQAAGALIGYRNVNKGARRLDALERTGVVDRRRSLWFNDDGRSWWRETTADRPNRPFTVLG